MDNLSLTKFLISINSDIIEKTALRNCHCFGLNSFIINEKPRIRLFIADNDCELFHDFNYINPIIPIHPHKYDDFFLKIEGNLVNHLYKIGGSIEFNQYSYLRLSDNNKKIERVGVEKLDYLGAKYDITELKSNELHSVSLEGEKCSWLIIETFKNINFKQVAYHQNLFEQKGLYQRMEKPNEFLKNYFNL